MLPAFISLVGLEAKTTQLFEVLQPRLAEKFPDENCRCFGDIVEDWSKTRIAGRQKRTFTPGARLLLRWGLFYENIETILKPAFEEGVTVGLARQFGFDVYAGAVAHKDCDFTLKLHKALVPPGVEGLGLIPPLYIFTTEVTPFLQAHRVRYFGPGSGQRKRDLPPEWTVDQHADAIIGIIREELAAESSRAA